MVEREIENDAPESFFPKIAQLNVRYSPTIKTVPNASKDKRKLKNVFLDGRPLDPSIYEKYLEAMGVLLTFVALVGGGEQGTHLRHKQTAAALYGTNMLIGFWALRQDDQKDIGTTGYILMILCFNISWVVTVIILVYLVISGCIWEMCGAVRNGILYLFALCLKKKPEVKQEDIENQEGNSVDQEDNAVDQEDNMVVQEVAENIIVNQKGNSLLSGRTCAMLNAVRNGFLYLFCLKKKKPASSLVKKDDIETEEETLLNQGERLVNQMDKTGDKSE